jgi:hypothetical protein
MLARMRHALHRSADVYEFSTETLFFGRQDAMQRTTLLPLAEHIRGRGLDPAMLRVAEVGCGTGRFHTFIKVCRAGCGCVGVRVGVRECACACACAWCACRALSCLPSSGAGLAPKP